MFCAGGSGAKKEKGHPCFVPCVRFTAHVRTGPWIDLHCRHTPSGATLGNGGWLTLSIPGLSPDRMRHGLRGVLTLKSPAAQPVAPFAGRVHVPCYTLPLPGYT